VNVYRWSGQGAKRRQRVVREAAASAGRMPHTREVNLRLTLGSATVSTWFSATEWADIVKAAGDQ
jgi:hypothetical protein